MIFASVSTSIHAPLVNWLPWSLLKISGAPCLASASFKASTQKSAHIVRQTPGQHLAAVTIHDRHKVRKPPPHWHVGNVCAADLVRAVDHNIAQQVWPKLMLWVLLVPLTHASMCCRSAGCWAPDKSAPTASDASICGHDDDRIYGLAASCTWPSGAIHTVAH